MSNLEEVDPDDEPRTFRHGTHGNRLEGDPRRRHREPRSSRFLLIFVALVGRGAARHGSSTTRRPRRRRTAPAAEAGLRDGRPHRRDRRRADRRRLGRSPKPRSSDRGGQPTTFTVDRDGEHGRRRRRSPTDAEQQRRAGSSACRPARACRRTRSVNPIEAVPESFDDDRARSTARHRSTGIGKLFSPAGVERLQQELHRRRARRQAKPGFERAPAIARRASSTSGSDLVGGERVEPAVPARRHQPHRRPVQPAPAAAVRRRARRDRDLREDRVEDPRPPGAGRLPQAHAGHRARARRASCTLGLSALFLDIRQLVGRSDR